jgi:hypothetical protein
MKRFSNIYLSTFGSVLKTILATKIDLLINEIHKIKKNKKKLFICGNGGSAANAIHLANDFLFLTIITASLLAFYHNFYDFVFLIPLAAFILKSDTSKIIVSINLPVILWFFYFVRFNQLILNDYFSSEIINLISCLLLLISFFSLALERLKFSIIKKTL